MYTSNDFSVIDRAIMITTFVHAGQVRKVNKLPYVLHPMESACIASQLTKDMEVIAASLLHDTIEDTSMTKEELSRIFGKRICTLVMSNSEQKRRELDSSKTWKVRKLETINKLKDLSYDQKVIVFADKLSNLRSTYQNYLQLGDDIWKNFNECNPESHKWYFTSILEELGVFEGTELYEEYKSLLNKLFGK